MSHRVDELRAELNALVSEYNASLGLMDREVENTLWRAARDAAQKAFDYQTMADDIRARRGATPIGDAEARAYEVGAECFQQMAHEAARLVETVVKFASAGLPFLAKTPK